jgi:hypothetical protein
MNKKNNKRGNMSDSLETQAGMSEVVEDKMFEFRAGHWMTLLLQSVKTYRHWVKSLAMYLISISELSRTFDGDTGRVFGWCNLPAYTRPNDPQARWRVGS